MAKILRKKTYIFLCLIVLLVISGCVDKIPTDENIMEGWNSVFLAITGFIDKIQIQIHAEKDGWNQATYEEYSKYYNKVCLTYEQGNLCSPSSKSFYEVKEKLLDMRSEGSNFERTWYMAFFNLQNGLELKDRADDFVCYRYPHRDAGTRANINSC